MKTKKLLAVAVAALMLTGLLAACGGGGSSTSTPAGSTSQPAGGTSTPAPSGEGQVYFLNFKPEQDDAYQAIAKQYTEQTGVPVKVVTAASGTYEQTLRSEMGKNDAPTIFQINGGLAGYNAWKNYTEDLSGSVLYEQLVDKSLVIGEGDGVYGIPFAIEGYGIIVNNKIMQSYFESDSPKATSLDEINTFDKLKEVVEDMQAKKDQIGIEGVFASTSMQPGEDWRWQTHLMNVPMYYEWERNNVDIAVENATDTITFEYADNFKAIYDLYLNNATIAPTMVGSKTVNDSMAEFALGQAAMVQNGNWAYGQIADVDGNTVAAEDVTFLPIYIGMDGEETQGLCIGTENYICINKEASDADKQASLDFLAWLFTSEEAKTLVTDELGFIAPFEVHSDSVPADPLGRQVVEWSNNPNVKNVTWDFTAFPSQQFKDNFGGNLLLYAQGQMDWSAVKDAVVADWASEKAAAA